jgi:PST family polysaccharide transporter
VPLGIAGVLNMALFRLDSVMVEAFDGIAAVGLYGVAFRFFESFLFVSWSLGNVTLPRYARDGAGARSARTFDVAVSASLSFYVPLTVGSAFAARWVVQLVFGARYADAADAVPWLTLAAALYAVTYQARTAVIGVGGRSSIAWVAALALTINVSANLVLIPRHGFVGAAMATALACGVEAVLTTVAVRRAGVTVRVSRVVAVPLTAGAVMAAALAGFGLAGAAAAVVGAAVYLVALAGAAVMLAPAERQTVLGLLRRPRVRPGVLDAPAG